MKPPRKYASATAFRVALEDRLKKLAQEDGLELQRVRRQAAFDRLLCRLFAKPDAPWLLKGGYAMELRLKTARTTLRREGWRLGRHAWITHVWFRIEVMIADQDIA